MDLEKFRNNQENFHIIIEERLGSITSQILLKLEEKSTSTISKITEIHKNEISQSNKDSGELQVISSQIS